MIKHYILNDDNEAVEATLMEWARFIEDLSKTRVNVDTVGDTRISTVFLGLNHNYAQGEPHLFETMVFGADGDENEMERCSTWEQAEEMHKRFVDKYTGEDK